MVLLEVNRLLKFARNAFGTRFALLRANGSALIPFVLSRRLCRRIEAQCAFFNSLLKA